MPKTKDQKRREAIERARARLPKIRGKWLTVAYGTPDYWEYAQSHSVQAATDRAEVAQKRYYNACKTAQCDNYGNPL